MLGTVVTIRSEKGFFFIRGTDGVEYFAHKSSLQERVRIGQLKVHDNVTFDPESNLKGPRACNVFVERLRGMNELDRLFGEI